jgi:hypothetical protein
VSSKVWQPVKFDGEESAAADAEPGLERYISLLKLGLKRGILTDFAPVKMEIGSIVIISWAVQYL